MSDIVVPESSAGKPRPLRRWLRWLLVYPLLGVVGLTMIVAGYAWWTRPVPQPPVDIFKGITYECRQLPRTEETDGLAHLFIIDLNTPGMQLWVTPVDPAAVARGGMYFTRWLPNVAREQKTSVLINATLFGIIGEDSRWPGTPARSVEMLVSDGVLNTTWRHSYVIWFESDLTPHIQKAPATADHLRNAKWAISGQQFIVFEGNVNLWAHYRKDRRTTAGVNLKDKRLFIGVFDDISPNYAARILRDLGAEYAVALDGGTSTGLVIGKGADHVRSGTYVYPLRAIPTHFGVIAPP